MAEKKRAMKLKNLQSKELITGFVITVHFNI